MPMIKSAFSRNPYLSPARQSIVSFLFSFRFTTLGLVVLLILGGLKIIILFPLALAIIYNALVFKYRLNIINIIGKYPAVIMIDALFTFILLVSSGGYKSPYYLYSFSYLVFGSFLFGYRGALVLSIVQCSLFYVAVSLGEDQLSSIISSGEHILTDFFFFTLTSFSVAWLSDLLSNLERANIRKASAEFKLGQLRDDLMLTLEKSQLSRRESEVLMLMFAGKTVEQAAQEIGISANTAKTYISRAYNKLDVSTQQKAIVKASNKEL